MKLFVTGAAGFIGSNYVRHVLATTDDEVTIFDALTYAGNLGEHPRRGRRPPLPVRPRRHLRPGRRRSRRWTATTPSSTSPPRPTSTARSWTRTRSCAPTASAPTCCATSPARSASSASCTSRPTRSTARSRTARSARPTASAPRSPYSAAKAGSDLIALSLPHDATACRSSSPGARNNFGPYQFPEKVIPLFTTNLLDGKKVPLYGDGGNVRDWIYVEDHNTRRRPRAAPGRGRRDLQHRRRTTRSPTAS